MNVVSSEAPSTISGVDIGRKIRRFVRRPAAERVARRAPAPIIVPSVVATRVDSERDEQAVPHGLRQAGAGRAD